MYLHRLDLMLVPFRPNQVVKEKDLLRSNEGAVLSLAIKQAQPVQSNGKPRNFNVVSPDDILRRRQIVP